MFTINFLYRKFLLRTITGSLFIINRCNFIGSGTFDILFHRAFYFSFFRLFFFFSIQLAFVSLDGLGTLFFVFSLWLSLFDFFNESILQNVFIKNDESLIV